MTFKITVSYKGSYSDDTNIMVRILVSNILTVQSKSNLSYCFQRLKIIGTKRLISTKDPRLILHIINCNDGQYTHKVWADSHVK